MSQLAARAGAIAGRFCAFSIGLTMLLLAIYIPLAVIQAILEVFQ